MTAVRRSISMSFPILALLFLGGAFAGLVFAQRVAPDSSLGTVAGVLALPLAFFSGMQLWLGFALLSAIVDSVRRLLGGQPQARPACNEVPSGSYAFVFTSLATCTVAGLVLGFVATEAGFVATLATVVVAGVGYGVACWLLARNGFLPFPE